MTAIGEVAVGLEPQGACGGARVRVYADRSGRIPCPVPHPGLCGGCCRVTGLRGACLGTWGVSSLACPGEVPS